jgi:hypothetical protein
MTHGVLFAYRDDGLTQKIANEVAQGDALVLGHILQRVAHVIVYSHIYHCH